MSVLRTRPFLQQPEAAAHRGTERQLYATDSGITESGGNSGLAPYQLTFAHLAGASSAVLGSGREDPGPGLWRWWRMCCVEIRDGSEGLLGLPRHAGVGRAEAAAVPRRFRAGGAERP